MQLNLDLTSTCQGLALSPISVTTVTSVLQYMEISSRVYSVNKKAQEPGLLFLLTMKSYLLLLRSARPSRGFREAEFSASAVGMSLECTVTHVAVISIRVLDSSELPWARGAHVLKGSLRGCDCWLTQELGLGHQSSSRAPLECRFCPSFPQWELFQGCIPERAMCLLRPFGLRTWLHTFK